MLATADHSASVIQCGLETLYAVIDKCHEARKRVLTFDRTMLAADSDHAASKGHDSAHLSVHLYDDDIGRCK